MYTRYISHDDASLSYMEDALWRFQTFRDVSLLWPAGTEVNANANALRTDLVKERKVDEEKTAETWTLSNKQCEMKAWWDHISHEIDVAMELDAFFSIPMIHLMSHWFEKIRRYGALQQFPAKRHE